MPFHDFMMENNNEILWSVELPRQKKMWVGQHEFLLYRGQFFVCRGEDNELCYWLLGFVAANEKGDALVQDLRDKRDLYYIDSRTTFKRFKGQKYNKVGYEYRFSGLVFFSADKVKARKGGRNSWRLSFIVNKLYKQDGSLYDGSEANFK
jgi:hypothetical protein